jgi:hypothetical protein
MGMMQPAAPTPIPEQPMIDPELLERVLLSLNPPQPLYRPGYTKPMTPDAAGLYEVGKRRWEDLRLWRVAVYSEIMMLRLENAGIFDDDKALYEARIIDDYVDTDLIADYNLAWQILSGMELRFRKEIRDDTLSTFSRRLATAVSYLRQQEEVQWSEGNANLRVDEAKHLLTYGMLVKRRTFDKTDPDFPFDPFLVDPCSVVCEWDGKRGLRRFWRVYRTTVGSLTSAYGDFTKGMKEALGDKIGHASQWDDDTEIPDCVEYWDTWYRAVVLPGGKELIKVTAHEYGEVPVTIGYGPLGEPMGTSTPYGMALKDRTGDMVGVDHDQKQDRIYQSVGFIRFSKESHKIMEAIARRALYGIKKVLDPATLRGRSNAAALNAAPEMDSTPGATNEYQLGEEKIDPFIPTSSMGDIQTVLQSLAQSNQRIKLPQAMHGMYDKSNISGVASGQGFDIGMDLIAPWARTLEKFHERDYARALRLFRNEGWRAKYGGAEPKPLMVPVPRQKQRSGDGPAFELSRELIDAVGPQIQVSLSKTRKQDMVPLAQTAKLLNDMGLPMSYFADEWFDIEDYEYLHEEWIEEQALNSALSNEQFLNLVTIPGAFDEEIAEAEGDPARQQVLRMYKQRWEEIMMAPPPMTGAPGGPGQPGPAPGPGGMNPPTAAGVSYPNVGQGPGSQTGVQGGPRGPVTDFNPN